MANLIRSTNLWGYAELVRDLGADPAAFMTVAGIRPGIEHEPDAFVPFATFCALLERTAAELSPEEKNAISHRGAALRRHRHHRRGLRARLARPGRR